MIAASQIFQRALSVATLLVVSCINTCKLGIHTMGRLCWRSLQQMTPELILRGAVSQIELYEIRQEMC